MAITRPRTCAILSLLLITCGCDELKRAPSVSPSPSPSAPATSASAPAVPDASVGWGEPGAEFLRCSPFAVFMHADTPYRLMKGKSIDRETDVHLSLERIRKGKVGAFASVLFVPTKYHEQGTVHYCTQATKKVDAMLAEHASSLRPGLRVEDFEINWKAGHVTVFRTIEGSWCFQRKLDALDSYYALGVRMIGLTWEGDHDFATSWLDYSGTGLTPLGRKAVERMNELGIAVDVSHMSDRAIEDVLSIAKGPVFATHSNARAVCNHPRNLKDDHIRRIAATGGVIGMNFYPLHLRKTGKATLQDVISHIRHVREVGGINAVGLGSDFDGITRGPEGLETPAELPNLRRALQEGGMSDADIAAIFGGNFLRAMRGVEQTAAKLAK